MSYRGRMLIPFHSIKMNVGEGENKKNYVS